METTQAGLLTLFRLRHNYECDRGEFSCIINDDPTNVRMSSAKKAGMYRCLQKSGVTTRKLPDCYSGRMHECKLYV